MMDEHVTKRKIQKAFSEPRAPEELIQQVILRAKAVTMGGQAQKQLQTAPSEKYGELASRALIGQLAAVSELPAESDRNSWHSNWSNNLPFEQRCMAVTFHSD